MSSTRTYRFKHPAEGAYDDLTEQRLVLLADVLDDRIDEVQDR